MTSASPAGRTSPGLFPARARTEAARILSAFAGFGAGTLSFGLSSTLLGAAGAIGAMTGAFAAALWGLTLFVWSVQTLRRGEPAWAGLMARLVLAAVIVHLAGVAHGIWWVGGGSARFLDITALSAAASELLLLGALGWLMRQHSVSTETVADAAPAGRVLMAAFAAALAVAAITTPGLAATTAGNHALPHGTHINPPESPPNGHHH